jgi:hypothetical protein
MLDYKEKFLKYYTKMGDFHKNLLNMQKHELEYK